MAVIVSLKPLVVGQPSSLIKWIVGVIVIERNPEITHRYSLRVKKYIM